MINYPVRIHNAINCKCNRIKQKLMKIKIKQNETVMFIVEKLYSDEKYKNFSSYVYITGINGNNNCKSNLNALFKDSISYRNFVFNYFRKYQWVPDESIKIRNILKHMFSICLCASNLIIDKSTCNAGFAIFGTKIQMQTISHCFNEKVTKTEFTELSYIKVNELHNISKKKRAFSIDKFCNSYEYDVLKNNQDLYTIIGSQSTRYLEKMEDVHYNFAFGKREWKLDFPETSFQCAKRELFEEFNIQFSRELWNYSKLYNLPQYIHHPGSIIYFLYLNSNIKIEYHIASETILLI